MMDSINDKLVKACEDGDIDDVKNALASQPDINYTNDHDKTPLMFAVDKNHTDVVKELLNDVKTNVTAADDNGDTALHYACENNCVGCIPLLGRDIRMTVAALNMENAAGNTPLMVALQEGNLDSVEEMVKFEGVCWKVGDDVEKSLEVHARNLSDRSLEIHHCIQRKKKMKTIPQFFNDTKISGEALTSLDLTELAQGLQTLDSEMSAETKALEERHEKEKRQIEEKHAIKITKRTKLAQEIMNRVSLFAPVLCSCSSARSSVSPSARSSVSPSARSSVSPSNRFPASLLMSEDPVYSKPGPVINLEEQN